MTRELLRKFVDGKCTMEEIRQVFDYLKTPEGEREFARLLDEAPEPQNTATPELEAVSQRLLEKLHAGITPRHDAARKPVRRPMFSVARVAASVLLVAVASFLIYEHWGTAQAPVTQPVQYVTHHTRAGERATVVLPDGSRVWLNAGSAIRYASAFNDTVRQVFLEGEGYFEVIRNTGKPFLVQTPKVTTRVLGTSFNVKAFPGEGQVAVSLFTGRVEVFKKEADNKRFLLAPNQQVLMRPHGADTVLAFDPLQVSGWREGILIFDHLPLREVAVQLERHFGVPVEIDNEQLNECRIRGDFRKESLINVLEVLKFSGDIEYTADIRDGRLRRVTLTGKGCR